MIIILIIIAIIVFVIIFINTNQQKQISQSIITSPSNLELKNSTNDNNISKPISSNKCDRADTSYCILKDYETYGDGLCIAPTNSQNSYDNIYNYNDNKFIDWLNTLYDRNAGSNPNKTERINVIDYVNRCKNEFPYLNNTIAAIMENVPKSTTQVPTSTTQVPTSTTQVPTSTTQVSMTTSQVPTTTSQVPTTTSQVSTSTTQVSTSTTQVPTTTTIVPTTSLPYLYQFKTHTFTNCDMEGPRGPIETKMKKVYSDIPWASKYINMKNNNGIQLWTVPISGYYFINAFGAAGGNSYIFGKGRSVQIITELQKGDIIHILVGQTVNKSMVDNILSNSGGGGGTYVWRQNGNDLIPIIIAGGGGGKGYNEDYNSNANSSENGNDGAGIIGFEGQYQTGGWIGGGGGNSPSAGGGAGFLFSGWDFGWENQTGGLSPQSGYGWGGGGFKNNIYWDGGFGGGGACIKGKGGGGGGGYSGGGGGGFDDDFGWLGGGGGGSYGITTLTDNGAINEGHGKVLITFLSTTSPKREENNLVIRQRELQIKKEEYQKQEKIDIKNAEIKRKKDAADLVAYNEAQRIAILESNIYKNSDSAGIKKGDYKRVLLTDFKLTDNLSQWFMLIKINSSDYYNSWQGIIGNMYNLSVNRGWGLWVNPSGYLHWSFADGAIPPGGYNHLLYQTGFDLVNLGQLINNNSYEIKINCRNNILKFTLKNLNTGIPKTEFLDRMRMVTNTGFITIGGDWFNSNEKFKGNINYVEVLTTEWELGRYNETKIPNNPSDVKIKPSWSYKVGPCHRNYVPNKGNYHGGTDCGNGDGIYNDWKSKGGRCPDGFWDADWCGTGCQKGGGYCADP